MAHDDSSSTTGPLDIVNQATAAEPTCHCHTLLAEYQRALTLASTIHTASSTATRQQLVDRIHQLSNRLLPAVERIDSRYTLHRRANHYTLDIPHPTHNYHMPVDLYSRLYDYQRESVHWLCALHAKGTGGILGDDMGLGKTVQVSALLSVLFHSRLVHHVLLIVPTSLIDNWRAELAKWCPTLPLHLYTETPERRARRLQQCLHSGGILLSTYGVLASLQDTPFDALVLDEGHRIKNADTQQTRQVKAIECGYRVLCTGTVVQNRLTELWCLMDFVCCGRLLGDRREFKEQWSDVIEEGKHKGASVELRRLSDELSRKLSELIRPYIMRRTKEEIKARHTQQQQQQQQQQLAAAAAGSAVPLPPTTATPELRVQKNELVVWLYPSEAQRRLYTALLSSGSEVMRHAQNAFNLKRRPLDAMSLLRTLCSHPRLVRTDHKLCVGLPRDVLVREAVDAAEKAELVVAESEKVRLLLLLLDESRRHGHRTLVFSWSVQMLDLVSLVLQHRAIPYLRIDGQVPRVKRTAIIEAFRQPSCPASVFLLSTGVGGVGLNLTSADRCVILDPDWNPATDAQSVDRCYRIGQQHNVVVHRFVTIGTIEEIVYRKQVFKQSLTRLVQGGSEQAEHSGWVEGEDEEGGGGARFTREELRGMFKQQDYRDSPTQRQLAAMYPPHLRHSYRELDEHIESLHRHGIFGVTDHDLLSDHVANANRPPPLRTQQQVDELDDPTRKERVVAAGKRAKQRAAAMTERLQQYVPQPPSWPALSRRKGKDEEEEKEEDWRDTERRKEREEESTAEWTNADDEEQEEGGEHGRDGASEQQDREVVPSDVPEEADGEETKIQPYTSTPSPEVGWTDGGQPAKEHDEQEEDEPQTSGADDSEEQAVYSAKSEGIDEAQTEEAPGHQLHQPHDDCTEQQADMDSQEEPQASDREGEEDKREYKEHVNGGEQVPSNIDTTLRTDEAQVDPQEQCESGESEENSDGEHGDDVDSEQVEQDGEIDLHDRNADNRSGDSAHWFDSDEQSTAATDNHDGDREEEPDDHVGRDEGEEENQYEVEAIVGKRTRNGRIEYRVRWKGYEVEHDSWQTEDTLRCDELVEQYEATSRFAAVAEAGERNEQGEDDIECGMQDEAEQDEVEQRHDNEPVGVDGAMDGEEEYGEPDVADDEHADNHRAISHQSPPTLTPAEVDSDTEADDHVSCEDEANMLVDTMQRLAVDESEADLLRDGQESWSEQAVDGVADESFEWDEAVEWAPTGNTAPSTPASAAVSVTPIRLHVHASVALLMDDNEPLSHSPSQQHGGSPTAGSSWQCSSASSPSLDTERCPRLIRDAVQLVHTALQLPATLLADSASSCACTLRTHIHRLPQLSMHETEQALELLTDAVLSAGGGCCDSVLLVAVMLMERLEQAVLDESRRQERPPGAGVRRWLCV